MKQFLFWLFAVFTIISGFIYFVSCFTPYISPANFWPMAFLALGFPFLAALMIVLILLWLFVRRKIAFFLLLVFFAGYKNLFAAVGLNFHGKKAISTKDSKFFENSDMERCQLFKICYLLCAWPNSP
jgi:hypothetical protein